MYPPKVHQFAYVTDEACTEDEILCMEIIIMKVCSDTRIRTAPWECDAFVLVFFAPLDLSCVSKKANQKLFLGGGGFALTTCYQLMAGLLCLLQELKWSLTPQTPVSWLNVYMQVAYLKETDELLLPRYPQATFTQIAEVCFCWAKVAQF